MFFFFIRQLFSVGVSMEKAAVFTPGMVPVKNQELNANSIVIKTAAAMLFSVLGVMAFFYSTWNRNFESAVWCIPLGMSCFLSIIISIYESIFNDKTVYESIFDDEFESIFDIR